MKLKFYIILIGILTGGKSFCQMKEEFNFHMNSIDSTFRPGSKTGQFQKEFIRYTINNLLDRSSDSLFISNRWMLPRIGQSTCDSTTMSISDTMSNGDRIDITVRLKAFEFTKHHVKRDSVYAEFCCDSIDGRFPLGAMGFGPVTEIISIDILFNGKPIRIPRFAYEDLYDPNICEEQNFERGIEAYMSMNGEYIYVYLYGGEAASNYFAKLVFDHEKYITRIVADYGDMVEFECFRKWSVLY